MVLVFAGRRPGADFPGTQLEAVGRQVGCLLDRIEPRVAIGSAAAGTDLIVAGLARGAGAGVELLLAGDRDRFRAESVADKGHTWLDAFDALLGDERVRVHEIARGEDADAAYRAVTAAIVARAEEMAGDDERIAVLAISAAGPPAPSHTAELVGLAEARGWQILRIDPTDPRPDRIA